MSAPESIGPVNRPAARSLIPMLTTSTSALTVAESIIVFLYGVFSFGVGFCEEIDAQ